MPRVDHDWFRRFFDAGYVAALRDEKPRRQSRVEVDFLVRTLGLPEGARILDVPCGFGRHAGPLARRGFHVVGVDLSPSMIKEARRLWAEGPRLRFRRMDMRRMAFRTEFDAVVNLYTSFGYFTPAQNQAVLRRMARALRPGGRLLVDHRDPGFDATLPRRVWYRAGPRRFVLEDRRFDRRTRVTRSTRLTITTGQRWVVQRTLRLQEFTLPQWRRMLKDAGLRFLRAYSGYDGRPYRGMSTRRLIVLAERPVRRRAVRRRTTRRAAAPGSRAAAAPPRGAGRRRASAS
ncbi:MAG TPA: class I SAM-dependent methyltransferase [Methylomirabilota bacterium]|nr:class I SAM-dependent methyltransferase [Methylomirabilota bacterium]